MTVKNIIRWTGATCAALLSATFSPAHQAAATTGSLLVPSDVGPGYYWATPDDSIGGYVEVCADYVCDVGDGMIENYIVQGRTMISVPSGAAMVNVQDASLNPARAAQAPAAPAPGQSAPVGSSGGGVLPEGATPCPNSAGSSSFANSASGSAKTSCPFAEAVRVAYGATGAPSPTPRPVTAASPVTGDSYTLTCAASGRLTTCTGGDFAVVYLY